MTTVVIETMNPIADNMIDSNKSQPRSDGFWASKFKAAGIHLLICILIATTIFVLMTQMWYPDGLLTLAGGLRFFTVLVCCDVILGPIITLIVYSIKKSKRERFWDFAIIGTVQVAALSIGLHAIIDGRPAFAVFTGKKIEIINAVHMQEHELALGKQAPFQHVSWQGPVAAIAQYPEQDAKLQSAIMDSAGAGFGFAYMPRFYETLAQPQLQVLQNAIKPIAQLKQLAPTRVNDIDQALQNAGLNEQNAGWLDVETNNGFGVAIVERATGKTHHYLDIDA
ncbi:hypothetical protein ADP71_14980 [Vitreoscilla sp. C1]|uniref:hypothetical protein n=1 Tax=Vitreoscilla sp. (strain C1) TaxID=96942 RepID=UPI00148EDB8E|nr:hypothetical protein [Vitreoscilla sp. C1]AUZ05093.2 hypothetical protein ADP71_14980 [Vitreoscilla sp. C1]